MAPIRICSVSYSNARPLTWGLTREPRPDFFSIIETTPASCADRLHSGEADVGLIPSIEFQRIPDVRALPQICIASKRQARSVLLVSKVASPEIRSVALDCSSRTSAALLKILLARRTRHSVRYRIMPPELPQMMEACDAALLIGDMALKAETRTYRVYDLASEWFEMTGLPFVFAFWAVRAEMVLPEGFQPFLASRDIGLRSIETIAREEGSRLGLPASMLAGYLRENIHYEMGKEEIQGLWLFYRHALEAGLLPALKQGPFFGDEVAGRESLIQAGGMP